MVYETFNMTSDVLGSVWDWAGGSDPHRAFIGGIIFWFVVERLLGFIATPVIKSASIVAVLILTFMALSALSSFSTYSDVERPAVSITQKNTEILKDALE